MRIINCESMVSVNSIQKTHMASVMHMCFLNADFVERIMKCYLGFAVYDEFFGEMILLNIFAMFREDHKQSLYLKVSDGEYTEGNQLRKEIQRQYIQRQYMWYLQERSEVNYQQSIMKSREWRGNHILSGRNEFWKLIQKRYLQYSQRQLKVSASNVITQRAGWKYSQLPLEEYRSWIMLPGAGWKYGQVLPEEYKSWTMMLDLEQQYHWTKIGIGIISVNHRKSVTDIVSEQMRIISRERKEYRHGREDGWKYTERNGLQSGLQKWHLWLWYLQEQSQENMHKLIVQSKDWRSSQVLSEKIRFWEFVRNRYLQYSQRQSKVSALNAIVQRAGWEYNQVPLEEGKPWRILPGVNWRHSQSRLEKDRSWTIIQDLERQYHWMEIGTGIGTGIISVNHRKSVTDIVPEQMRIISRERKEYSYGGENGHVKEEDWKYIERDGLQQRLQKWHLWLWYLQEQSQENIHKSIIQSKEWRSSQVLFGESEFWELIYNRYLQYSQRQSKVSASNVIVQRAGWKHSQILLERHRLWSMMRGVVWRHIQSPLEEHRLWSMMQKLGGQYRWVQIGTGMTVANHHNFVTGIVLERIGITGRERKEYGYEGEHGHVKEDGRKDTEQDRLRQRMRQWYLSYIQQKLKANTQQSTIQSKEWMSSQIQKGEQKLWKMIQASEWQYHWEKIGTEAIAINHWETIAGTVLERMGIVRREQKEYNYGRENAWKYTERNGLWQRLQEWHLWLWDLQQKSEASIQQLTIQSKEWKHSLIQTGEQKLWGIVQNWYLRYRQNQLKTIAPSLIAQRIEWKYIQVRSNEHRLWLMIYGTRWKHAQRHWKERGSWSMMQDLEQQYRWEKIRTGIIVANHRKFVAKTVLEQIGIIGREWKEYSHEEKDVWRYTEGDELRQNSQDQLEEHRFWKLIYNGRNQWIPGQTNIHSHWWIMQNQGWKYDEEKMIVEDRVLVTCHSFMSPPIIEKQQKVWNTVQQIQEDLTKVEERYMGENDFIRQLKETISQQERRISVLEEENQRLQRNMEEERRRQKEEECFRQVFENNLTLEQMRYGVV